MFVDDAPRGQHAVTLHFDGVASSDDGLAGFRGVSGVSRRGLALFCVELRTELRTEAGRQDASSGRAVRIGFAPCRSTEVRGELLRQSNRNRAGEEDV